MNNVKIMTRTHPDDLEITSVHSKAYVPIEKVQDVYLNGHKLELITAVNVDFDAKTGLQTVSLTLIANTEILAEPEKKQ